MPEELTALEKKIFEINVVRFSIYSFYLQTSYYINPRGNCINEFYTLNQNVQQKFSHFILNNIDSEKAILTGIRKKYDSYAEKLLDSLEKETFVPHNLYFEDKQYRFDLKMVGFEAFPLLLRWHHRANCLLVHQCLRKHRSGGRCSSRRQLCK